MRATITWDKNVAFAGVSGSGHTILIDGPPDIGGEDRGPRPMELMLLCVGSCSSVDVVHILKKARQPVSGCVCEINGTRAGTDPKVFTAIHMHFIVTGEGLSEKQVDRAVTLSAQKYCSASLMLEKACPVTHDFELRTVSGDLSSA